MQFLILLGIAIGLSFDTFAVSVSAGISRQKIVFKDAVPVALTLAVFQAGMPLLGYLAGSQVEYLIRDYDHWVTLGLLSILGVKMIIDSFRKAQTIEIDRLGAMRILIMAIATSVDALVVGIGFAFIHINIYTAILIIGTITFLASMLGMLTGKAIGGRMGKRMEILGGLILIAIGIKILLEHI